MFTLLSRPIVTGCRLVHGGLRLAPLSLSFASLTASPLAIRKVAAGFRGAATVAGTNTHDIKLDEKKAKNQLVLQAIELSKRYIVLGIVCIHWG
jgi:hypothetical protein